MKPILLDNWSYRVKMEAWTRDVWVLTGRAFGHPNFADGETVHCSTPKAFDPESMVVITTSGSVYMLGRCAGNLEQQIGYILEDVKRAEEAEARNQENGH